jgi:hypothetical protein
LRLYGPAAESERTARERSLARDRQTRPVTAQRTMLQELASPTILLLCLADFCLVNFLNTFATWSPQIIREVLGGSTTPFVVGLVGAIPPIFTIIGMVLCAPDSDRTGERLCHTPSCARSRRRLDNRGLECDSGNPSDGVDSRVRGRLYRHGLVLGVLHASTYS